MSAVLIAGGAGYIGSHAAKLIARSGRPVVIYDNLSAGHREAALGAPLVEGDVHDVAGLRDCIYVTDLAAAPRRAGDSAVLYASNARIQADLGWRPQYASLETIVETAWRWHRAHPRGFAREER